jgi:hypothetical protein
MSEAADQAEREVEDFFNEEIFGAKPPVENEAPFPEAEPEAKPISEVATDTPAEEPPAEEPPAEGTPEPTEEAPTSEEVPPEQGEPAPEEGTVEQEEEYVAWARKQYGEDLDLDNPSADKLARAAFEKEKMLGRKAEEARELQEQAQARELQERIDALNTVGNLTPEEDAWVNESLLSGDPGEWAYNALQAQRPDLYASIMDRWSALGEDEARRARVLHSRVLQAVSTPQPSEQESYTQALGQTFISLGLDIERHGPLILAKAEELGTSHPSVQGMMSQDDDVRRIATRSIYDLVAQTQTTVAKAKAEDVVQARVQEEQLRQQAAGITGGGPRVETPKKSKFWESFDAEIEERGWDGNRPTYGRDE